MEETCWKRDVTAAAVLTEDLKKAEKQCGEAVRFFRVRGLRGGGFARLRGGRSLVGLEEGCLEDLEGAACGCVLGSGVMEEKAGGCCVWCLVISVTRGGEVMLVAAVEEMSWVSAVLVMVRMRQQGERKKSIDGE